MSSNKELSSNLSLSRQSIGAMEYEAALHEARYSMRYTGASFAYP